MSWETDYYLGYIGKDGKLYPLGPYDSFGGLHSVLTRSKSFEAGLADDYFHPLDDNQFSQELIDYLTHNYPDNEKGKLNDELRRYVQMAEFSALPTGSTIKKGYFLIDDVKEYEQGDTGLFDDIFYDWMTPEIYAAKAENELKFGAPPKETDEYGGDVTPHSCRDYMYYSFEDYTTVQYEAKVIREAAEIMKIYSSIHDYPNFDHMVVWSEEG